MPGDAQKECPLCGGTMRLREIETVRHIPGSASPTKGTQREWSCPDCDHFEEAEND